MTIINTIFVPPRHGSGCGNRPNIDHKEFCSSVYPAGAVAIEATNGPPGPTPCRTKYSFDHHAAVFRPATLSASEQAYEFVKLGLHEELGPMTVYLRDPDEDSEIAYASLAHPEYVGNSVFSGIATTEGREDRMAGLYPMRYRSHLLGKVLWIGKPHALARRRGLLHGASDEFLLSLHDRMQWRIREVANGRGRELEPEIDLEVLGEYENWTFFREIGIHARLGIGMRGVRAFGSLTSQSGQRWWYSFGRISPLVKKFPLERLGPHLNAIEGLKDGAEESWGGNPSTIIASPFGGSLIPPKEMGEIVNRIFE